MKTIRYLLLSVLVSLASITLFAVNGTEGTNGTVTVSLTGTILDKVTKEALPGVAIQVVNSDVKIYSDPDGTFSLNGLKPGAFKLKVTCISYKEKVISVDVDSSGKNTLSVQLESVEP